MGEQPSSGEQGDLGRRWVAAWSAHDPEAVSGILHDDGEYDDVAKEVRLALRDQVVGADA